MCEVDKSNFKEIFDEIEYNVKKCTFVSVDCEFSGLTNSSEYQNSLFDSAAARYLNLKESTSNLVILQFGLSTYTFNRDLNQYDSSCYKFLIVPRPFGFVDDKFLCQASSLEFLCRFKFDMNKVVYDGIPFMKLEEEMAFRKMLKDNTLYSHLSTHLESDEVEEIQEICCSVSSWLLNASVGDIQTYTPSFTSQRYLYILGEEIKKKFSNIVTFTDGNLIKIKLISDKQVKALDRNSDESLEELLDSYIGFSRVFKLLADSKKPFIGHNLLLDLLIMYRQFYKPLPGSVEQFKKSINKLFPEIYDTKVISYELQRSLSQELKFEGTSLGRIYDYLNKDSGASLIFSPSIVLRGGKFDDVENQQIHDAGWDSYMTGVCFIKLSHIFASKLTVSQKRPLTSVERFAAVKKFKNIINLARAANSTVNIEGKELDNMQRPPFLYIAMRNRNKLLNVSEVSGALSKYGNFDIKPLDSHSALLAVMNFSSARDILKDFRRDQDLKVVRYNFYKHSPVIRKFIWSGLVISAGVTAFWAFMSKRR